MNDPILQATCEAIVTLTAQAVDKEPDRLAMNLSMPGGVVVGRQITIDATEKGGLNMCRLSVLDPAVSPQGEVVRIEYEHDKQTKYGVQRVYSVQSVRRKGGELVLLENFLAASPQQVREQDFSEVQSEAYAQETVLKSLRDWVNWRAWQLQEAGRRA